MDKHLRWNTEERVLHLSGELNHETLADLWQQREVVMQDIKVINVSALQRVDSAGLALLIYLQQQPGRDGSLPYLKGVSNKLLSLITLYNLQGIIKVSEQPD